MVDVRNSPAKIKNPVVDLGQFQTEKIEHKIKKYLHTKNLDISGSFAFTRPSLIDFVETTYGIHLSKQSATEAIFACRGKSLEASDPKTQYDSSKLVEWLKRNLPSLVQLDRINKQRIETQRIELKRKKAQSYSRKLHTQGGQN